MQALIPFLVILGIASATNLNLLPYAYYASPVPVFHQSVNTRTGEHAYSYAGGPSAKEEVKDADGVARGSYSYIDANGILQSVFYVADENGFRVAATNLPTDDDLPVETAQVLLASNAYANEHEKSSRRKRSLENSEQTSNRNPEDEKKNEQSHAASVQSLVYQVPDSVLIHKLLPTATSHQSQVQIHNNVHLEELKPQLYHVPQSHVYQPFYLHEYPLATSHQSQVQVRSNVRVEVPEAEVASKDKPVAVIPDAGLTPIVPVSPIKAYQVETVPLPSYHENRIQFHRDLGLEGPGQKNAIKIKESPLSVVHVPLVEIPTVSAVHTKEVHPVVQSANIGTATVTTSVSSHGVSQIHPDSKVKISTQDSPALFVKTAHVSQLQPFVGLPFFHTLPYATASHYRTQIHGN